MPSSLRWSELDDDRRNSILLIGGISAVVILALALIGYGYYNEEVAPNQETVLTVGNRSFDYSYLEHRVHWDLSRALIDPANAQDGIAQTIQEIQEEEIIRQTGKRLGLTATEDEIIHQMSLAVTGRFSADDPDKVGTLREGLRGAMLFSGLSVNDFREIAIARVYENALEAQFTSAIPAQLPHANMRLIMTSTEANALAAKQEYEAQLAAGRDTELAFGFAASKFSEDPKKAEGGEQGWLVKGTLPEEVEAVAFLTPGVSGVISASDGFYMVSVREIQTQDVTVADKNAIAERSLKQANKLTQDENGGSEIRLSAEQLQRLILPLQRLQPSA